MLVIELASKDIDSCDVTEHVVDRFLNCLFSQAPSDKLQTFLQGSGAGTAGT